MQIEIVTVIAIEIAAIVTEIVIDSTIVDVVVALEVAEAVEIAADAVGTKTFYLNLITL